MYNKFLLIGQPGLLGSTGQSGDQGQTGITGSSGQQGSTGQAGPSGAPGSVGSQGPTGSTGQPGQIGSQGSKFLRNLIFVIKCIYQHTIYRRLTVEL